MSGSRAGVSEQNGLRRECHGLPHDLLRGHRPEFRVQKSHFVSRVDQRPADGQQAQRRQMLVRNPAADGRMGGLIRRDAYSPPFSRLSGCFTAGRLLSVRVLETHARNSVSSLIRRRQGHFRYRRLTCKDDIAQEKPNTVSRWNKADPNTAANARVECGCRWRMRRIDQQNAHEDLPSSLAGCSGFRDFRTLRSDPIPVRPAPPTRYSMTRRSSGTKPCQVPVRSFVLPNQLAQHGT